jgi:hypothetical protein
MEELDFGGILREVISNKQKNNSCFLFQTGESLSGNKKMKN